MSDRAGLHRFHNRAERRGKRAVMAAQEDTPRDDMRRRRRTKWQTVPALLALGLVLSFTGPSIAAWALGVLGGAAIVCPIEFYRPAPPDWGPDACLRRGGWWLR